MRRAMVWIGGLASVLVAAPVWAQSISGFSVARNAGNSGTSVDTGTLSSGIIASAVSVTLNTTTKVQGRYRSSVTADTGIFTNRTYNLSSDYTGSFNVTAPGAYILYVSSSLNGAFTLVDDGTASASADLSGVTGTQTGGTIQSGSLSLGDPGNLSSNGGGNQPFAVVSGGLTPAVISGTSNGVSKAHTLRFTFSSSCNSASGLTGGDECAVRLGVHEGETIDGQNTTIGDQSAGHYPGPDNRNQNLDGHFFSVELESLCGNNTVDAAYGEQCDQGLLNGIGCCTTTCQLRPNGFTCRASAGVCDVAEACNGSSPTCPSDSFRPNTTVCRGSAGVCDLQETCTGFSAACPSDAKSTAVCRPATDDCDRPDNCDGVSNTCPADQVKTAGTLCRFALGGACDVAEVCDGVSKACPADGFQPNGTICRPQNGSACDIAEACTGSSPTCPTDAKSTSVCRAAAGICDQAESCNGINDDCPTDVFLGSTSGVFVCRASTGACDPQEVCDGSGINCPADAISPAGTLCRAAAGACDVFETCDGTNVNCPADVLVSAGIVCRASAGVCDVAETCTGSNVNCPADGFRPNTFTCRGSAGVCDVSETCTGSGPNCPADAKSTSVCRPTNGDCDVAESCDGVANTCPTDTFIAGGTECRASAGACDIAESCTGSSAACPTDAKSTAVCRAAAGDCDAAESCDGIGNDCPVDSVQGAFVECRASAGGCDPAENCDGIGAACPADQLTTAGTVCRASVGACDVAETCDGSTPACPADVLVSAGTTCRAAAGVCDIAETCSGLSGACPADALQPATTVCRPSTGVCDITENCTGSSAACPADATSPDTDSDTVCDLIDNCDSVANASQTDSDGDLVGNACDICTNTTNITTTKTRLVVSRLNTPVGDDKVKYKGEMVLPVLPFNPILNGARVAIFDNANGTVLDATLPGGFYNPATKVGWKANAAGTSYKYTNKGTFVPFVSGINKVVIKRVVRVPGLVKFVVTGKTGSYPVVAGQLPLRATMVVEGAIGANNLCGDSIFSTPPNPYCAFNGSGATVRCR